MRDSYVAIHCHSFHSPLEGIGSVEDWVKGAKAKGLAGLAITDHGDASSMLELYEMGKKHNFPVILGCEFYLSMDESKEKEDKYCHIVAWVKNMEGYRNICRLSYLSYQEKNFYYKPRIMFEDLVKHKEGLMIGSACIGGPISRYLQGDNDVKAILNLEKFVKEFGDDFYIELHHADLSHSWDDKSKSFIKVSEVNPQARVNQKLLELAEKYKIKVIASPDAHMIERNQKEVQDVQLKNFYKNGRYFYETYSLPTRNEFFNMYKMKHEYLHDNQIDDALDATYEILEKTRDLKLEFSYSLPEFDVDKEALYKMIEQKGYINLDSKVYRERLEEELKVIMDNGKINLLPYFLILEDLVRWCESNDVMVGPGRGSASGSLLNFALGITKIDPIKYNLSFTRFLNETRVKKGTLPDIDLDFNDPQKAKDYLVSRYGQDHVFCISVNQTCKIRSAIKDAIRVLDTTLSPARANEMTQQVVFSPSNDQVAILKESLKKSEMLYKYLLEDRKDILSVVLKMLGQNRQRGVHAAAVVISKDPVYDIVPIAKNKVDGNFVTQYTMEWCEKAGLIKIDVLGLNTLNDISYAKKLIKKNYGTDLDLYNLEFNDKKVLKEFEECNTDTVFQFNTDLVKGILRKSKIDDIDDLAMITSLARPGPMDSGMVQTYINRCNGMENIIYPHSSLEILLKDTYGILIFQEQIMKAVQILGGFSDAEADDIRKAMGKKKIELLDKSKDKFLQYATSNFSDINLEKANQLWDMIYTFGGYGFNKSHAIGYSAIAYICQYLKKYYPFEWWCSVLSHESDTEKIKYYYNNNKERFVLPHVNKSYPTYVAENEKIIMPLHFLNRIGDKASEAIFIARQGKGPFTSFMDFYNRVDHRLVNKTVICNLIWANAFEGIENKTEKELLRDYYYLITAGASRNKVAEILKEYNEEVDTLNRFDIIRKKSEACPIFEADYQKYFKDYFEGKIMSFDHIINDLDEDDKVCTSGVISSTRLTQTKKKDQMAFVSLMNNNQILNLTVFPKVYEKCGTMLNDKRLVEISGKLNIWQGRKGIIVNEMKFIEVV